MTERSAMAATFVIERKLSAPRDRVFNAFADPALKAQWFGDPGLPESERRHRLDFRVGGSEYTAGGPPGGPLFVYDATYADIVPNERIVATYEMQMDGQRISVSIATTEFLADGDGTLLRLTEQGVYLDGLDTPEARQHGTNELYDALTAWLNG